MTFSPSILWPLLGLALAGCALTGAPETPSGRALFQANCAACHGASGRGDGPAAAELARRPADLTRPGADLTSAHVMAYVYGPAGPADPDRVMPEFGDSLAEPMVLYDSGDGIASPTPLPLIELAEYVKTLQREAAGG